MSLWKSYEWDIETYDGDEVADHWFADNLDNYHSDELKKAAIGSGSEKLVLVLDTEDSRMWAYAVDGKLPQYFSIVESDGNYYPTNMKVPKRFNKQLDKELK